MRDLAPNLEIRVLPQGAATGESAAAPEGGAGSVDRRRPSIRDYAKKLDLRNTYERLAALGYYATKAEGKASFTVKDMTDWFGLCGFKKPQSMSVALSDAKRKYGYMISKGRDQWSIATGAENLMLERDGNLVD